MQNYSAIQTQFNLAAAGYDSGRRKFIPCFDDYYEKTTAFAAAFAGAPRRIVDLGAGTGLLTMYYLQHFPEAEYILVDVAEDMLEVAKKRFENIPRISYQVFDYTESLFLENVDLVISALSIHHLENEQKAALFGNIKSQLSSGCWFINYDQFCCSSPEMDDIVNRYWIEHLYSSGLSENELARWRERRKLDRECTIADEVAMLRNARFKSAECIYSSGKFAVIAAQS